MENIQIGKESFVDGNGVMHLNLNGTVDDIFTITHEMTHKLSVRQENVKDNNIKEVFGETPTITMEFLLNDYLEERLSNMDTIMEEDKKLFKSQIQAHKEQRYSDTFANAKKVAFEKMLMDIKREGKDISLNSLQEYLNSLPEDSLEYSIAASNRFNTSRDEIHTILDNNDLTYYMDGRYVLGTMAGSYLHLNNREEDLQNLIIACGLKDTEKILDENIINLPMDKYGVLNLTDSQINELVKCSKIEREGNSREVEEIEK